MVVLSDVKDEDEFDEEPGEVIESAPPQKVGEERQLSNSGLKKKLIKRGLGWETPDFNDQVTVHYVGTLLDGTKFDSTRDTNQPMIFTLGQGQVVAGLDHGVITMKKGEVALFTLPDDSRGILQFEVELISWIKVVDVCKDGGILKKIMEKGSGNERPGDLDEVLVKYQVVLDDGTVVAETPEGGVEFHVKDGYLFPRLPKVIMTMTRGEKAKLIVQPQYAFGEMGREAGSGLHSIPPNSVLHVNIELVSFKPVINVTGDSMVLKKILKEGEGASTADEGANVTVRYTAMLEDGTVFEKRGIDETQPLKFITDEEQVITGLDRAVETMKKGERAIINIHPDYAFGNVEVRRDFAIVPPGSNVVYDIEMMDFIKVLDIEFYNVKALYRRAQAYIETGDYLLADVDVKKALEVDPQNREVKVIKKKLKQLQADSDKKDAKLYENIFAHKIKDSPVATKRLKVEKEEDERKNEEAVRMEMDQIADSAAPSDGGLTVDSC
ncbi:70 kDa peptidyl-prolyl isomerase-like isoform X2 [Gastrolobium bilobum]|uniref:70 kDa peptidyl-prolyl isomerase-like isoform X2 n=1 Tax=Gastrolobium bilobum TaxID=150636 RepID=UPI002AB1BD8B|nr:70 kDa peptidyl-prolyl isomerase-like isoform X2 [Gastrolobium bilobum]